MQINPQERPVKNNSLQKGEIMRGLKIQDEWIRKILSGEKTMEVRSRRYDVLGQRIALGNSGNGLVEGYANVKEIIEIPMAKIPNYESKHLATKWLLQRYGNKQALYCYCLTDVKKENKPFEYP
jgi:hypothetical protein